MTDQQLEKGISLKDDIQHLTGLMATLSMDEARSLKTDAVAISMASRLSDRQIDEVVTLVHSYLRENFIPIKEEYDSL